ncbi:kinesin-related protein 4-like [Manduca sexta]|uniref:kinesin-related protein 4-like n=1 Tax=Manduca sexta TaxID=7130 RepID=UPI00188F839C|nr:kinesin-related protein 4-like [Manduca sexta]
MSSNISKSSSNIPSGLKKQTQIKSAVVTNLKKKKSLESVVIRPRSVPCHESCSKKTKDLNKNIKKSSKVKSVSKSLAIANTESCNQFGDTSNEASYCGSYENITRKQNIAKQLIKSNEAINTDSFFQHLFLGRPCSSIVTYPIFEQNTSVLQKAKMFQSLPLDNNTPKSLNSYLIHRKPVSLSRFKMWDRYPSPGRPQSPRSISWPGRMQTEVRKFDSLSKHDEFGSTSSLATVRSKSEPPSNKLYFSQTSRPKSPVVIFYKKDSLQDLSSRNSTSPTRLILTQTSRPVSPRIVQKTTTTSVNVKSPSPTRIILTETSRPISPVVTRRLPSAETDKEAPSNALKSTKSYSGNLCRSHSASPVSIRSPSYRRIHNARLQSSKTYSDLKKSLIRTRSAGDADKRPLDINAPLKVRSDSNLHVDDPEYDEYIQDIQNIKARSERFRELNRYYAYLERVAELEKATSTSELRHRKKDEEIIDFDRWKKIRAIERAEEELNNLYRKLKIAQSEKDVLFYPRDPKDFRWNFDKERGLRIKEKSVEDLKDHFQQISYDAAELDQTPSKDIYKPLWRGSSVAETAFHINRKNDKTKEEPRSVFKPTIALHQDSSLSDLRKQIGLGTRLWSSLSMEQVNALKNQLNAIYSKEIESKSNKESEQFIVDVRDRRSRESPTLHVRCNSLITPNQIPNQNQSKKLLKSESIAAMPCPSVKELKNNVNKIQMSLSENEKRKISQTLSKELLDRMNKYDNQAPLSLKQELENSRITEQLKENVMKKSQPFSSITNSVETLKKRPSIESAWDGKKMCNLYTNDKTETQYQSSASETETASSDISNKTVIYCGSNKEVKEKGGIF